MITCNYVPDPPRVTLDVTSMPAGTARVEVVRIDSNGSQAPVRGAADVPVQDTAAWTATDWDVPVGRAPIWRATYRNSAGGLLGTETGDLSSDSVGPELLTNGSFDSDVSGWGGWTWIGNGSPHSTPGFASTKTTGASMTQTVAVTAGAHRLSVWSICPTTDVVTVSVTPAGGTAVSATVPLTASPIAGKWAQTILNATIPAGVTQATVAITHTSGTAWVSIDDVSLRAVTHYDGTVPAPDCDLAWISNPYDPTSAMLATLMAGSDDETSHDMDVSLSLPGRRTHLPSAVVGVRGLGGARTLVVRCWTQDEAQRLENLLTSTTTLLIRSAVIRHRTGCLYVVIGGAREMSHHNRPATPEATTWTLSADEVDPGHLGILVPPWTYQKSAAYVAAQTGHNPPTYGDRLTVFPLHIDATRGV